MLLLPALFGPGEFMITIVFLMGFLAVSETKKTALVHGSILAVLMEIFTGDRLGSVAAPYLVVGTVYLWLQNFFEIKIYSVDVFSPRSIIKAVSVLIFLVYWYSWIYLFFHSGYSFNQANREWLIMLRGNILIDALIWSSVIIVLSGFIYHRK